MKTLLNIAILTFLLAAPNPCFALWDVWTGSKKEAKELGMEIRSSPNGAAELAVELKIKTDGKFSGFSRTDHPGRVELQISDGPMRLMSAALKEDRSKPGRVIISFIADRTQLDKLTLRVMVPFTDGGAGGAVYELRVKDFVELGEVR